MDILDKIIAHKKEELKDFGAISQADVKPSTRDFGHFISSQRKEIAVIAEIKRATPFRGVLTQSPIEASQLAQTYEDRGAAAISVLTDEHFFQGSLKDLTEVSEKVALPVLRKDFIIDDRQIFQARLYGADAVLLIVRCLDDVQLKDYLEICHHVHMRALVEVHHQDEVEKALKAGGQIIGINNRNLKDGSIDLAVTFDLVKEIPKEVILVSESGISTAEDIRRLHGQVDAVLVGTSIVQSANPGETLQALVDAGCSA